MKASWVGIAAAALMLVGQASAADIEAGKAVYNKSVCKNCHLIDMDTFGPSYQSVGAKYGKVAGAKESLTAKVKNGTKGAWGSNAMPPQKSNISDGDLSAILDYILSLK